MTEYEILIEKLKKQKTISTHLVLGVINEMQAEYAELVAKNMDLANQKNTHHQRLTNSIRKLQSSNEKLRKALENSK